jgi:hypothetical protein
VELEDIQPFVAERLTGYRPLGGAVVIQDDGTYPKTPGLEEGLATVGLVLVVWQVESLGAVNVPADGSIVYRVGAHVIIEENQQICRAPGGAQVPYEQAIRLVLARVGGSSEANQPFLPADQPFANFGKQFGVNRAVVSFTKLLITIPDLLP